MSTNLSLNERSSTYPIAKKCNELHKDDRWKNQDNPSDIYYLIAERSRYISPRNSSNIVHRKKLG